MLCPVSVWHLERFGNWKGSLNPSNPFFLVRTRKKGLEGFRKVCGAKMAKGRPLAIFAPQTRSVGLFITYVSFWCPVTIKLRLYTALWWQPRMSKYWYYVLHRVDITLRWLTARVRCNVFHESHFKLSCHQFDVHQAYIIAILEESIRKRLSKWVTVTISHDGHRWRHIWSRLVLHNTKLTFWQLFDGHWAQLLSFRAVNRDT